MWTTKNRLFGVYFQISTSKYIKTHLQLSIAPRVLPRFYRPAVVAHLPTKLCLFSLIRIWMTLC